MISPRHSDEWWFHSCTFKDGLGAWFPATRMLNGLIFSVSFTSSCHTFKFISVLYSLLFTAHHPYHEKRLFNSWHLSFWSSLEALLSFPAWCLSQMFCFSLSRFLIFFFFFCLFQPLLQVEFPLIKTRRSLHFCVHLTKPSSGRRITCSPLLSVHSLSTPIPFFWLLTPKWNEPLTDCV